MPVEAAITTAIIIQPPQIMEEVAIGIGIGREIVSLMINEMIRMTDTKVLNRHLPGMLELAAITIAAVVVAVATPEQTNLQAAV